MNTFVHYEVASLNISYIEKCLKKIYRNSKHIFDIQQILDWHFFVKHAGFEIMWKNFVGTRQATYENIKGRI